MEPHTTRAEAERLLGISEKLLQTRDFNGSRDFALLAQETEPLLEGSDQILAVTEVLLAADKRINNHLDWYAILQLDRRCDDLELVKKQYRRLALLLHPDKNKFAYSDAAFKLVADAWAVLSNSGKKSVFDSELSLYCKVDLVPMRKQKEFHQHQQDYNQNKFLARRSPVENTTGRRNTEETATTTKLSSSFWTSCPYCYNLYEYPRAYDACCMRCQNCERSFTAVEIPSMPPLVAGKEAYHCCWGFFPMGFAVSNSEGNKFGAFPNSTPAPPQPPMFASTGTDIAAAGVATSGGVAAEGRDGFVNVAARNVAPAPAPAPARALAPVVTGPRKRGRPKKYL